MTGHYRILRVGRGLQSIALATVKNPVEAEKKKALEISEGI
jgi:hypothetical protein